MQAFLFTDIEGSTRLWEKFPAAMSEVLSRHDELITSAVTEHGGRVVKQLGDGVFAVFEAGDPLGCAVEIQRRLAAADWGPVGELRVRVAVHVGEAEERGGDYFGQAVNRASRLVAAGWGGQILLSAEAARICQLPPGASLVDLGVFSFRELTGPQRVFQLTVKDVPWQEFPPVRLRAGGVNLPAPPTPLVGRANELAALREMLVAGDGRLVTLVGPGGVGKTRLAVAAAADVVHHFDWGVYFVSLAPLDRPDGIVPAVAGAMAFTFYGRESPKTQLLSYLAEKEVLLVLDNFEHVIAGAGAVGDILEAAPGVKVLATSRERLGLRGERVFEVKGLPVPPVGAAAVEGYDAAALFVECARRVNPTFTLTPEDAEPLARICRYVDGIPLALELASSWTRALAVKEIEEEIKRDADIFHVEVRDLPERQKSLRTVFDYSWRLLKEEEQKVLARLAVFPSSFTREAAAAVTGAPVTFLAALVDKSLLKRGSGERYEVLAVLKKYIDEKLAAEEREEAVKRFIAFYAAFLRARDGDIRGARQREALEEVAAEMDNVRAAWSWATARADAASLATMADAWAGFYDIRGLYTEAVYAFGEAARSLAQVGGDGKVLARLRMYEGCFRCRLAEYDAARDLLEEAVAAAEAYGDADFQGTAAAWLGVIALRRGEYADARRLFQKGLQFFQIAGNQYGVANALENLGNVAYRLGEYAEAKRLYGESLELHRSVGNRRGVASSLSNLGDVATVLGDFQTARAVCEESLAIQRELGFLLGVAGSLNNLGDVALAQGDYARAAQLYEESHAIQWEIGNRWGTALALENLAAVAFNRGEYDLAATQLHASLVIREEIGDQRGVAASRRALGDIYFARGEYDRAKGVYQAALDILTKIGDRGGIAKALTNLGDVALKCGNYVEARRLYAESLGIARGLGDLRATAGVLNCLGNVAYALGEYDEAIARYEESLELSRRLGFLKGESYASNNLGDVYEATGDYGRAVALYKASLEIDSAAGDRRGIAISYNNIGRVYFLQQKMDEAEDYLKRAVALCRDIGYREGVVFCLSNLGQIMAARGDAGRAEQVFREGLLAAAEMGTVPWALEILTYLAEMLLRQGKKEKAAELFAVVYHHQASERAMRDRAAAGLAAIRSEMPAYLFSRAQERAQTLPWEMVAADYLPTSSFLFATTHDTIKGERVAHSAGYPALVVPRPPGRTGRCGVALRTLTLHVLQLRKVFDAAALTDYEVVED